MLQDHDEAMQGLQRTLAKTQEKYCVAECDSLCKERDMFSMQRQLSDAAKQMDTLQNDLQQDRRKYTDCEKEAAAVRNTLSVLQAAHATFAQVHKLSPSLLWYSSTWQCRCQILLDSPRH